MDIADKLARAQEILGYTFTDPKLLQCALTHASASQHADGCDNYERLEFLGDAYISYFVSRELFSRYPTAREGKLTSMKAFVVSGVSLSQTAQDLDLKDCVIFAPGAATQNKHVIERVLEDVFEALVGALLLDGGEEAAGKFIEITLSQKMDNPKPAYFSAKSRLQELLQARGLKAPHYELVKQSGPPHAPTFYVKATAEVLGSVEASGTTRKGAETRCAEKLIKRMVTGAN